MAGRVARRLGRRGTVLTLKGLIATLYGYGQIVAPQPDRRGLHLLLLTRIPLCAWAGLWIAAGVVALACAWLGEDRDWPGFLAVWLISSSWSLSNFVAWWPLGLAPRGWIASVIFGAFGLVCLIVVGWTEPGRGRSERRGER